MVSEGWENDEIRKLKSEHAVWTCLCPLKYIVMPVYDFGGPIFVGFFDGSIH